MRLFQGNLFDSIVDRPENGNASTFVDNMSLPVHGWFRYSAGFSALWVQDVLTREKNNGRRFVLDPFAGSGTVLLEAESRDLNTIGVEPHPFIWRVAKAKLEWHRNHKKFLEYALAVLEASRPLRAEVGDYPPLINKCYPPESLSKLDSLRKAWEVRADGSPNSELAWLALASILRECSPVGTAPWQYVLPRKQKAKILDPYVAFEAKVYLMCRDMALRQEKKIAPKAMLLKEDARESPSIPDAWADLVITSPPYANNYDYADATRLEMSFFGEVRSWADLQEAARKYLVRSCTQHVATITDQALMILEDRLLKPIKSEIIQVVKSLGTERDHHGGKKPYHTMIAAYFTDMAKVWYELRRVTSEEALVVFVIGDSAPYGIYVPVERWLGELALAAGFKSFSFERLRSRNIKWKNRKHRVPLHEGILWVRG